MGLILLFLVLLAVGVDFGSGSSLQSIPVLIPNSFSVQINEQSEGIKRQLHSSKNHDEWQFFYFCDNAKYKGKCGFWVDEKNNKITDANNNVKRQDNEVTISKTVLNDSGAYTKVPENPDANQAYLERLDVYVQEGPKPPRT